MSTINSFSLNEAYLNQQKAFQEALTSAHAPAASYGVDSVKFSAVKTLKFGEEKKDDKAEEKKEKTLMGEFFKPIPLLLAGAGVAAAAVLSLGTFGLGAPVAVAIGGALVIAAFIVAYRNSKGEAAAEGADGSGDANIQTGGQLSPATLKNFPIYAGFASKTEALIDKKKQGDHITIRNLKRALIEAAGLDPFDKAVEQKLDDVIKAKKLGTEEVGSALVQSQASSTTASNANSKLISVSSARDFVKELFESPNVYLATENIKDNATAAVQAYLEQQKEANKDKTDYEAFISFDTLMKIVLTGRADGTPSASDTDTFLHKVIQDDSPIAAYNPKSKTAKDNATSELKAKVPENDRNNIIEAWAAYCAKNPISEPVSSVPAVLALSKFDQAYATLSDKLTDKAGSNSAVVLTADEVASAFEITDSKLRSSLTTALSAAIKTAATKGFTSTESALEAAKKALADVSYDQLEDKVVKAFNQVLLPEKRGYLLVNALAPSSLGQKLAIGKECDPQLNDANWHEAMTLDDAKLVLAKYIKAKTNNYPAKAPQKPEATATAEAK
jgi:hypothetical protein